MSFSAKLGRMEELEETVACTTLEGTLHEVKKELLDPRPSAYGVILKDGELLVTTCKTTGKIALPGGGANPWEKLDEALHREVFEECGIEIAVGAGPFFFKETFFYYEPLNQASHCYLFYFVCRPVTFDLCQHDLEDESVQPRWVDVTTLREEDFQVCGKETLALIRQALADQVVLSYPSL